MDTYAEQSLVGSVLVDQRCLKAVRTMVKAADFASSPCEAVFRAACRLADAGQVVDPVMVLEDIKSHAEPVTADFIWQLMEITPTAANAEHYAKIVHENALRRAVEEVALDLAGLPAPDCRQLHPLPQLDLAGQALEKGTSISALVADGISRLQRIGAGQTKLLVSPEDAANEFLDYRDRVEREDGTVVSTGYHKLDSVLGGGMVAQGLYILAARPGVGKTTVGMKIAEHVAAKKGVLFVSLEMSREQLTARRIAERTALPIVRVLHGELDDGQRVAVTNALGELSRTHLAMNASAGATVPDIALMARSVDHLGLVVVDYLGLLESENRATSIYERVTANSNALKRLARSLDVPVLCLAQLNRASEQRADKRPTMADLRDSGAIEQDADGVLLLHRPSIYFPQEQKPKPWDGELLELDVAKNRHGPTGNINLTFYGRNGRVTE